MKTRKVRWIRIATIIAWFCTGATLLSRALPNENYDQVFKDQSAREKLELLELGIVSTITAGLTVAAIADSRKKS